jgi:hypothetical protein
MGHFPQADWLATVAPRRREVHHGRPRPKHPPEVYRRPRPYPSRYRHPRQRPRPAAGRRARHRQIVGVGTPQRRHLRQLATHRAGHGRHHRRPNQILVELRPADGGGTHRPFPRAQPRADRDAHRRHRPLRRNHPLRLRSAGRADLHPLGEGDCDPRTGAHRVRPPRVQHHRHCQHARSRGERDVVRAEATLQLRGAARAERPAAGDGGRAPAHPRDACRPRRCKPTCPTNSSRRW